MISGPESVCGQRLHMDGLEEPGSRQMGQATCIAKNRHGRFRDGDLLRGLFETVLQCCIEEGLVGREGFAVDASLAQAEASDRTRVEGAAGCRRMRRAAPSKNISLSYKMPHSARQPR